MLGHLDEGGRKPSDSEEGGGEEEGLLIAEEKASGTACGFDEHQGRDHDRDHVHIVRVVGVEVLRAELRKERINGDLHEPDDPGHCRAGDELDQEKVSK